MTIDLTTLQRRVDEAAAALFDTADLLNEAVCRLDEGHQALEAAGFIDRDFAEVERLIAAANRFTLALVAGISANGRTDN